jgi:hypothetical protein
MRLGVSAGIAILVLAAFARYGGHCQAADLSPPISATAGESGPIASPNSILVFAGRMSTTTFGDTLRYNLNLPSAGPLELGVGSGPYYDNYIVGAAYDRDLFNLGHGFYFGIEVGIADRFGEYEQCCRPIIMSNSMVESFELWTGPQLRYAGILLFDLVRIGGSVTFGLSAATASIGAELQREIDYSANARLLYYLGPELNFSTPSIPNLEFVLRVQHRSGGYSVPLLPTLGNMGEGYNANVAGIRYRF